MKNIFRFFSSKNLPLALFGILAVILIPTTFLSTPLPALNLVVRVFLGLLAVNIACCTINRWNKLTKSTLIIHIGCLLTIGGSLISSLFGYVATVNVHEDSSTDIAFRWDIQQDVPLDFQLKVLNIQKEYYPTPLKVGVLKEGRKHKLFELLTGESFHVDGYRFRLDTLNVETKSLTYTIYDDTGATLGSYITDSAENSFDSNFPYEVKLVAFKDPAVKRIWIDLAVTDGDKLLAKGTSEVNAPFIWDNLRIYHTLTARDPYGFAFVGIQMVKDPGIPYVYFGFFVLCLGLLLSFKKLR